MIMPEDPLHPMRGWNETYHELLQNEDYDFFNKVNDGDHIDEKVIDTGPEIKKIRAAPLPEDDPMVRKPDITRAQELLDWSPEIDLKKGIEFSVDWFDRYKA